MDVGRQEAVRFFLSQGLPHDNGIFEVDTV